MYSSRELMIDSVNDFTHTRQISWWQALEIAITCLLPYAGHHLQSHAHMILQMHETEIFCKNEPVPHDLANFSRFFRFGLWCVVQVRCSEFRRIGLLSYCDKRIVVIFVFWQARVRRRPHACTEPAVRDQRFSVACFYSIPVVHTNIKSYIQTVFLRTNQLLRAASSYVVVVCPLFRNCLSSKIIRPVE